MENNYIDRIEVCKTLKDLYVLMSEISKDADNLSLLSIQSCDINDRSISKCQNANYYLTRVKNEIEYLEKRGCFLNKVVDEFLENEKKQLNGTQE